MAEDRPVACATGFFLTGGLLIHSHHSCANDGAERGSRDWQRLAGSESRSGRVESSFPELIFRRPRPRYFTNEGSGFLLFVPQRPSAANVATRSPRECNRASPRAERRATRRAVMLPGAGARPHRSPTSQSPRVQKACQKAPDDESESPRTRICAPAPGSRVVSPRRTRRLTLNPPHRHRQRSPPRIRRRSRRPARSSAPRFVAPRQTLPILRSARRLPRSPARRCHRARASA